MHPPRFTRRKSNLGKLLEFARRTCNRTNELANIQLDDLRTGAIACIFHDERQANALIGRFDGKRSQFEFAVAETVTERKQWLDSSCVKPAVANEDSFLVPANRGVVIA